MQPRRLHNRSGATRSPVHHVVETLSTSQPPDRTIPPGGTFRHRRVGHRQRADPGLPGPKSREKGVTMRKTILLASGITIAAASLVALACTANASDSGDGGMIKQPTMSYTSPSNKSTPVHANLSRGTPVDVVCVAEGQLINGNSYWARINSDGQTGFVHRDAVHIPLSTPFCR